MLKMHSFIVELVLTVLFDVFNYSDLTLNSALFFACLFSHLYACAEKGGFGNYLPTTFI